MRVLPVISRIKSNRLHSHSTTLSFSIPPSLHPSMPLRYKFYSKFSFAGKQLIDDDDNSMRISGVTIVVRETRRYIAVFKNTFGESIKSTATTSPRSCEFGLAYRIPRESINIAHVTSPCRILMQPAITSGKNKGGVQWRSGNFEQSS